MKTIRALVLFITSVVVLSCFASAIIIATSTHANAVASSTWYAAKKNTFEANLNRDTYFCKCPLDIIDGKVTVDYERCGFKPDRKDKGKEIKTHLDHIFPAAGLGAHLACWTTPELYDECKPGDTGPECCYRTHEVFRAAYTDIVNLAQVIDKVNMSKSNRLPEDIRGDYPRYGVCDVEIDVDGFEPPEHLKGDVARIYQYMYVKYGGELGIKPGEELSHWIIHYDYKDPIDQAEIDRNNNIIRVQGYGNPKITPHVEKGNE